MPRRPAPRLRLQGRGRYLYGAAFGALELRRVVLLQPRGWITTAKSNYSSHGHPILAKIAGKRMTLACQPHRVTYVVHCGEKVVPSRTTWSLTNLPGAPLPRGGVAFSVQ